ncbi:LIC10774 family surface protein [Leptospira alexanderi]|uniref:PF07602 family protein n=1 Tax=Leptospira alexanderi serovar Manhao 3 str. L 60 TaxID=1049759 RepID=V6IER1_9LEPT|nr:DUF1565 domain-containing protein [Leptospira alexanderi]EQA62903.1 PF07602 family protein [Leptospira alexanderi serovar Manhao 3 str. L 60]
MKQIFGTWIIALLLLGGCTEQGSGGKDVSTLLSLLSGKTSLDLTNHLQRSSAIVFSGITYYVDALHGSDSNTGIAPSLPFKTITKAASLAASGDGILVAAGTYNTALGEVFPIKIADGVTILGDEQSKGNTGGMYSYYSGSGTYGNPGPTFVQGGANLVTTVFYPTFVLGNNSVLGGFKITNPITNSRAEAVLLNNVSGATARKNTLTTDFTGGRSVYIYSKDAGGNHTIADNIIKYNTVGIEAGAALLTSRVENNWISNNYYGILMSDSMLDLGGGIRKSVGQNWIFCNTAHDLIISPYPIENSWLPDLFAKNNIWDHKSPTIETSNSGVPADIYNHDNLTNLHLDNSYLVAPSLCTP